MPGYGLPTNDVRKQISRRGSSTSLGASAFSPNQGRRSEQSPKFCSNSSPGFEKDATNLIRDTNAMKTPELTKPDDTSSNKSFPLKINVKP